MYPLCKRIRTYLYANTYSARIRVNMPMCTGKHRLRTVFQDYCVFASTPCPQCLQIAGRFYLRCTVSTDYTWANVYLQG